MGVYVKIAYYYNLVLFSLLELIGVLYRYEVNISILFEERKKSCWWIHSSSH